MLPLGTSISVYAYNLTPVMLTSLEIGGVVVAQSLAPLEAGGAPTPSWFSLADSSILKATFSNGTQWSANISTLAGLQVELYLWICLNGFFGTTSTGQVQQLSYFTAIVHPLQMAIAE